MKNRTGVILGLLALSLSAYAAEGSQSQASLSSTPTGFFVGLGVYNHHYEESTENAFFMSNKGSMKELVLSYTGALRWQGIHWSLEVRSASGDIDYISDGTGTLEGAENTKASMRLLFSHDMPMTSSMSFSPYYGLGYRVHEDNKQNMTTTTGHTGYHRQSQYYYTPIGLAAQMRVAKNVLLIPRLQWNVFYHGQQTSDYDIINNQYLGYGYELGFKTSTQIGDGAIDVDLHYTKWKIDDSSITTYPENNGSLLVREPENFTSEMGLTLGYRF